ncbi:uncharacterized protein LOC105179087 [Sesamum indicum]|uniref:Uncharacterized protein LOC105179087 n=1 Tax=Sesamum indicum TaxID=4182 RepID=A0A6I9UQL1_SESIN|nr:uncharacterized protein LOC105179087 [Sesamum indicum]
MQHPNGAGSSHSSRYDKVLWNTEMERVFIELMHEEFITHRLQSSTFSPSVWARVTERMNSIMSQGCLLTTVQLKGKLNRLRHAWRLLNEILNRGTGWGWDSERNTMTDDAGRLEELYRNTATGGLARSSSQQCQTIHSTNHIDDEQMDGTQSGSHHSRDEYEDTTFSQSVPMTSPDKYFSSPGPSQASAGPSGSGRRF